MSKACEIAGASTTTYNKYEYCFICVMLLWIIQWRQLAWKGDGGCQTHLKIVYGGQLDHQCPECQKRFGQKGVCHWILDLISETGDQKLPLKNVELRLSRSFMASMLTSGAGATMHLRPAADTGSQQLCVLCSS